MAKYTPFRPLAKISSAHMNPLYIVKRRGVFEVTPATVVGVSEQLIRSLDPTLACRKTPVTNLNVGRYPTLACRKTPVTNLNLGKRPSFACRKTPVTNLNVGNSTVRCCSVCVRKERVRTQYCSCAVCVCVRKNLTTNPALQQTDCI